MATHDTSMCTDNREEARRLRAWERIQAGLREGRVRGVLLWNLWKQVEAVRQLIAEPGQFRPENLKGRSPVAP